MNTPSVALVGITHPRLEGVGSAEELIAYTARVSNPANQHNSQSAPKLLKYLAKNQHWSPFEMVHILLEINTTRDIARQILRHRSFSFQEFSQRYATVDSLGFTYGEARLQDANNRQASNETDDKELKKEWELKQIFLLQHIKDTYAWALNSGLAKEVARKVLPEGITNSRMYMSGSLRSWIHYCQIRTDIATQKEHREVALLCKEIILKEVPSIGELLNDPQ
jgi:thymidylate synthase (FAD)